ncbi:hypothetical protein CPB84DRAFT_1792584 [Gymnopilus junonius]|uniref:Protein kinase domain-containing protein n=1 Tax=Gymnopilus junonius TaxID=109634 RepID=A0A9P5NBI3_GYMJU|nr:hypothetical protein CPB84DRAFT_1792584 [Gymnopilus junonius]
MVNEVLSENLLASASATRTKAYPCPSSSRLPSTSCSDWVTCIHTDLKPENVLICIDDVESIIST